MDPTMYDEFQRIRGIFRPAVNSLVRRLVTRNMPRSGSLLELGCGAGELYHALLPVWGQRLIQTDRDPQAIQMNQARHPAAQIIVADVTRLPFGDESVAGVLSMSAVNDVDDIASVMHAVARVLRPGGTFLHMDSLGQVLARHIARVPKGAIIFPLVEGRVMTGLQIMAETEFPSSRYIPAVRRVVGFIRDDPVRMLLGLEGQHLEFLSELAESLSPEFRVVRFRLDDRFADEMAESITGSGLKVGYIDTVETTELVDRDTDHQGYNDWSNDTGGVRYATSDEVSPGKVRVHARLQVITAYKS